MSEPNEIYAALVRAQSLVRGVGNDAANRHHNYKYTSAEALIAEGRRCLTEAGLALVEQTAQHHLAENGETVALTIAYVLVHASGAMPVGPWTVPVLIGKGREVDKAEASARTYSLGYCLRGLLMIDRPADADPAAVDQRDDRESDPRERYQQRPASRQQPSRQPSPLDDLADADALVAYCREHAEGLSSSAGPARPRRIAGIREAARRIMLGDVDLSEELALTALEAAGLA